jgi:hypothetical protein
MIYNLFKSTTVKLFLLLCTVLITLIFSSLIFNSQIDRLKKQVDTIYFANLIPIVKLQIILDNYQKIISCKNNNSNCIFEEEKKNILQEWNYYNQAFKYKDERIVVNVINEEVNNSFSENKIEYNNSILAKIIIQIVFLKKKKRIFCKNGIIIIKLLNIKMKELL